MILDDIVIADLNVFDRKQRGETLDDAVLAALAETKAKIAHLNQEIKRTVTTEKMLVKETEA